MWRVVLDHAVLTSALLNPHRSPARLLDYALEGQLRLFATPRLVSATGRLLRSDVLRRRHGLNDRELSRLLADLPVLLCLTATAARTSGRQPTTVAMELVRCALRSHADFLVTSLPLDVSAVTQGGTQIVTADQLVKLVGRRV